MCPGLKDVPCDRTVHMGQSDDPRCPLHLTLPPPMYQPEQEPPPQEQFTPASKDMYLSAAELQPTESLPLEFSDVRKNYVTLPVTLLSTHLSLDTIAFTAVVTFTVTCCYSTAGVSHPESGPTVVLSGCMTDQGLWGQSQCLSHFYSNYLEL